MDRKILVRALAMHAALTSRADENDDLLYRAELMASAIDEFIDGKLSAELPAVSPSVSCMVEN